MKLLFSSQRQLFWLSEKLKIDFSVVHSGTQQPWFIICQKLFCSSWIHLLPLFSPLWPIARVQRRADGEVSERMIDNAGRNRVRLRRNCFLSSFFSRCIFGYRDELKLHLARGERRESLLGKVKLYFGPILPFAAASVVVVVVVLPFSHCESKTELSYFSITIFHHNFPLSPLVFQGNQTEKSKLSWVLLVRLLCLRRPKSLPEVKQLKLQREREKVSLRWWKFNILFIVAIIVILNLNYNKFPAPLQ